MSEYTRISGDIFTVAGFLTSREFSSYIALAESLGFVGAPVNTVLGPQRRPDVRNDSRVMLDDPERAADLWARIRDYTPLNRRGWEAVGVYERLRFYQYDRGQQFDWHHDGCFERDNGERSQLTYMIYLNEGFIGGETRFSELQSTAPPESKVVPKTGLALVFFHPLLHKGEVVTEGRRYVLRTDIMYKKQ